MIAAGCARAASTKRGMSRVSCWQSASICTACVNPARCAARKPASTARPLPRFCGSRSTRSQADSAATRRSIATAHAGPLPSSTSQHVSPLGRNPSTSFGSACAWSKTGTTTQGRKVVFDSTVIARAGPRTLLDRSASLLESEQRSQRIPDRAHAAEAAHIDLAPERLIELQHDVGGVDRVEVEIDRKIGLRNDALAIDGEVDVHELAKPLLDFV